MISSPLYESLSDLAGFRNILVHIYWKLDIDEIYNILQNDLEPLKDFEKSPAANNHQSILAATPLNWSFVTNNNSAPV